MEPRLQKEIASLERTLRRARFLRDLMAGWLAAAAVALIFLLVQNFSGWISHIQWLVPLLMAVAAAVVAWRRHAVRQPGPRAVVSAIEHEHPELRHLLSAAAEQEPDLESGEFRYLQLRVVEEALQQPGPEAWRLGFDARLAAARKKNVAAAGAFLIVLFAVAYGSWRAHPIFTSRQLAGVTVTPGDTEVERGTSLVISARFDQTPPAEATLVLLTASGKTQHIPLERHLADPVFGASLSEVTEGGMYHVEYPGGKTRDYKISVFAYPALVRADAHLRFPDYTGLTNRTIADTLRVTAVEGTRLSYELQLNKPVVRARLMGQGQTLELQLASNSIALLNDFPLTNSARYSLSLEDAQGRTNKFPADFVFVAVTNQRPELKLVFPNGDQEVSRLEEMQLQGEAVDDFGLVKYGVGYTVAGQDSHLIELGQAAPGGQKRSFSYLLPLESLDVDVDQVIAYFIWADDVGPNGKVRRTFSDIFFAQVRPFDTIFRADQSGSDHSSQGGQSGPSGNRGVDLAELQKEIIIATWKLQQEQSPGASLRMP